MPESNGVSTRGVSSFENLFREYRGRPPTEKETQQLIACDRLFKTTDLDPTTILVIVGVIGREMSEKERAALFEQMARIEATTDDLKAQKAASPAALPDKEIAAQLVRIEALLRRFNPSGPAPVRDLCVYLVAVASFVSVTLVVAGRDHPISLVAAFVIGLFGAFFWLWIAPLISRDRGVR